jgi:hypothetical protein
MSLISGNVTFYDNSVNESTNPNSIIGTPLFLDTSVNQGTLYSAVFSGSSINEGEIQTSATFAGNAVNSGTVELAIFSGSAVNLGVINGSGLFYGTAVNSGVISGNAIFADTTANNGTVNGNANFAAGASNVGGSVSGVTGGYGKSGPYSDGYYTNGVIDQYGHQPIPVQAIDNNFYYTYSLGTAQIANGNYSNGYFSDGSPNLSYSNSTAVPAIDDSSHYYTYCNGASCIASGLYSNYAITGGVIDASYSTNMPIAAIDCGCQIYENGVAICVTGVNYILDNSGYYGALNDIENQNTVLAQVVQYKSNMCEIGLVGETRSLVDVNSYTSNNIFVFGSRSFSICCLRNNFTLLKDDRNESTPLSIFSDKYFIYCSGLGIAPSGLYSNYAFDNSIFINSIYFCNTPQIALDNCCYYTYNQGVATPASGAYSNYYFEGATIALACSIQTPVVAQDNNCYYLYISGEPIVPNGPYSNFYFNCNSNLQFIENCTIITPVEALDCAGYYYNYCAGLSVMPNGPYSNYYFNSGIIDVNVTSVCMSIDTCCVYKYNNGVASYAVCAQGTNVGTISCCCYGVGTNNGFVCADGSIYALDNESVIGYSYCCADGNDNCGVAYCALGYWICYYTFDSINNCYGEPINCVSVNQ